MYLNPQSAAVKARQAIEKRIVLATIDELLAQGFALSVYSGGDGDEPQVTTDRKAIVDGIMECDDDYLKVWKGGKRIGWIHFVYGNDGYDVMSDYTTNLEALMPKTLALARSLDK